MPAAVAAGCRVPGLVTPVPSRSEEVARAASARPTNASPARFCESTTSIPSHPAASARSAMRSTTAGWDRPWVNSSSAIGAAYG